VILEELFESQEKRRLFNIDKMNQKIFKIKHTQTISEMMETFVNAFHVPKNRMRLWILHSSQSQKFIFFDADTEGNRTIDQVTSVKKPWIVFLEFASPDVRDPLPTFDPINQILIFLKFYDPKYKRLHYIGSTVQQKTRNLSALIQDVNQLMGFDIGTELSVFDEANDTRVENLDAMLGLVLSLLPDNLQGYILIFEKKYFDENLELPTVEDFFSYLVDRVEVTFCDKSNHESEIILELSYRNTYDQMARAVAHQLNTDPNKLQFFTCLYGYKEKPGNAIPYTFKGTLKELIQYKQNGIKKLFYLRLSLTIHEMENKKLFKCIWVSMDLKEEKELILYPNKGETVKELLIEAVKNIQFSEKSQKRLRLLRVGNNKIQNVFEEDILLELIHTSNDLVNGTEIDPLNYFRIEEVPTEDIHLAENEMLIGVAHYSKHDYNCFGTPFLTKAKHGEPYGALKQRIQEKLNVPDKEWETYKFTISSMGRTTEVNDDTLVDLDAYRIPTGGYMPFFGLDHVNKSRKRSSFNSSEKAIKIYN